MRIRTSLEIDGTASTHRNRQTILVSVNSHSRASPRKARCVKFRRCPRWVNRVVLTDGRSLPVFLDKQTFSESVGMSQKCQQETRAPQQSVIRSTRRRQQEVSVAR